ncbi:MAG: hypothetical protein WCV90_07805 [Candidatus Woesearchaeota archaeon]
MSESLRNIILTLVGSSIIGIGLYFGIPAVADYSDAKEGITSETKKAAITQRYNTVFYTQSTAAELARKSLESYYDKKVDLRANNLSYPKGLRAWDSRLYREGNSLDDYFWNSLNGAGKIDICEMTGSHTEFSFRPKGSPVYSTQSLGEGVYSFNPTGEIKIPDINIRLTEKGMDFDTDGEDKRSRVCKVKRTYELLLGNTTLEPSDKQIIDGRVSLVETVEDTCRETCRYIFPNLADEPKAKGNGCTPEEGLRQLEDSLRILKKK